MRRGKYFVYLLTILFAMTALFFWSGESRSDHGGPVFAAVDTCDGRETVACWASESGDYYVFLPSYAVPEKTFLHPQWGTSVWIGEVPLDEDTQLAEFSLNVPYEMRYKTGGEAQHCRITFLQSANIPALHIELPAGGKEYIHAEKGNSQAGAYRIYSADGSRTDFGALASIRGRGNATWLEYAPKPYSMTLSKPADLLGMGMADDWILLANAYDPTHLRNKLVYDFSEDFGLNCSPSSDWVDLYMNGEYMGLYLLCERNQVHEERVTLENQVGYLVSMDLEWRLEEKEDPYFVTDRGIAIRIHDQNLESDAVRRQIQSAENAILSPTGVDSVSGKHWQELIDLDSWVRKFLIEEIFGNADGGRLSQFFYGDARTEKLYAGPVWDYDISIGNPMTWRLAAVNALYAAKPNFLLSQDNSWFYHLYQNEAFYDAVVETYRKDFPGLSGKLEEMICQYGQKISPAAHMNQIRWTTEDPVAATKWMSDYLHDRIAFLNSLWIDDEQYYTILVDFNDTANSACYMVQPGDTIPALREYEQYYGAQQWCRVGTDEFFDIDQPIYENLSLYRKNSAEEGQ